MRDLFKILKAYQKIFTANGCIVSGDDLRSGHREQRHDGTGPLNSRLRNNQRENSQFQRPVHPDTQASYEALVDHDNENIVYPVHDVARDISNDDVIDE